jgi:SNF2 family DNA or RNA helicase
MPELRQKTAPLVLRRTAADCDDVAMPVTEVIHVPVELGTAQRERYEELRRGILTRLDDRGKPVSKQEAESIFLRARQVVSGLANLDNVKTGESAKLDRVMTRLTGDLSDEPVVVYCYFRPTLADLAGRLAAEGITSVRIWGEQHAREQEHAVSAFNTGAAPVMLITDAGGMGLDLQVSRRLIVADIPVSAGRFRQLVGRIRRDGSEHRSCYVQVLVSDTPVDAALAATVGSELSMFNAVMDAEGVSDEVPWPDAVSLLKAVTG